MRRYLNLFLCWLLGHQRTLRTGERRWSRYCCTRCGRFVPTE